MTDLRNRLRKYFGTGSANSAFTQSASPGNTPSDSGWRRLVQVTVAYSAAPTHAGITVTLNSEQGAGYDTQLDASAANARYHTYIPAEPIYVAPGDAIDVLAPAGGAGITASTIIILE